MRHYTIDEIDRFVHGSMGTLAKIKCSAHLKSCSKCKELLSQVESNEAFIGKLKGALQQFEQSDDSNSEKTFNRIAKNLKGK